MTLSNKTTTSDGFKIGFNDYREATFYYRNGYLTRNQVRKYFKLKEQRRILINNVLLYYKKIAKVTNTPIVDVLNNVIELEDELSLEIFGKPYYLTEIEEHMELMKLILSVVDENELRRIKTIRRSDKEDRGYIQYMRNRTW